MPQLLTLYEDMQAWFQALPSYNAPREKSSRVPDVAVVNRKINSVKLLFDGVKKGCPKLDVDALLKEFVSVRFIEPAWEEADKEDKYHRSIARFGEKGIIYLVRPDNLVTCGLIGYVGQTVDTISRRKKHLSGADPGTAELIETIVAKGGNPVFKVIKTCPTKYLNREEVLEYKKYADSGWTLWNRRRLTETAA